MTHLVSLLLANIEAPPMDVGNAPVASALPSGATFDPVALFERLPHSVKVGLLVFGATTITSSIAADFLDRYAKAVTARGEKVPAWLEAVGGTVHGLALNLRKGWKLLAGVMGRGK